MGADRLADARTGKAPPVTALDRRERAACAVCADWMATAPMASAVAGLAAVAALTGLATGGAPHPVVVLVALGFAERWLALRLRLEARLFVRLADGQLSLSDVDQGLHDALGVPAARAGRPLAGRIQRARRLHRWHAVSALGMVLMAVLAWA